jgi:soluble lytic murein transglycosylase-like protein
MPLGTCPARADHAAGAPLVLTGTQWEAAARPQALDPILLYALALARSGTSAAPGSAQPWPWTLEVGGATQHYANREQAATALAQARQEQRAGLAVGILAIPLARWRQRIDDPPALLEPAANLRLGAAILADSWRATPDDPALALGHFAEADPAAARAVGQRVLTIAAALGRPPFVGGHRVDAPACGNPGASGVRPLIEASARRFGIDPAFALAVAHTESRFNQAAVSPQGARGVMQLMPATAARYGANAHALAENIDAGVRYLRDLAERFGGDPVLVAAAYNAGEHAVVKFGQVPPFRETQRYVPQVLAARALYGCTTP